MVEEESQDKLTQMLNEGELEIVDYYPMDSSLIRDFTKEFELIEYPIYKDSSGNKFIRLPMDKYSKEVELRWYNIEHPKVLYDIDTDFAIYENVAVGGIRPMDLDFYKREYWFPRIARQLEMATLSIEERHSDECSVNYADVIKSISLMFDGNLSKIEHYIDTHYIAGDKKTLLEELDWQIKMRNRGYYNYSTRHTEYNDGGKSARRK